MFTEQSWLNLDHKTGSIRGLSVLNLPQCGVDALILNIVVLWIEAQGRERRAGRNKVGGGEH